MDKIMAAERRASEMVTEARVFKVMLLNQTRKHAEEKAQTMLSEAEAFRRRSEGETKRGIATIESQFSASIQSLRDEVATEAEPKRQDIIEQLIDEVNASDSTR